jgi:hypothetical protein
MVCYYRGQHPEVVTQSQAHAIAFWAAAWFLYIGFAWWSGQCRLRRAARLQQDAPEAGNADADANSSGNGKTSLATMYHALNRKPQRANGGFFQTKIVSRLALAALIFFDIVSLVYLPPDMLTDYLSTVNCEVRVEDLHWNRIFYQFTAHPRPNSSFLGLGYCPESQQWASIIREMTKHADETRAEAEAYAANKATWAEDWDDDEIDYDQPVPASRGVSERARVTNCRASCRIRWGLRICRRWPFVVASMGTRGIVRRGE